MNGWRFGVTQYLDVSHPDHCAYLGCFDDAIDLGYCGPHQPEEIS